jgi:hypothetical protein
VIERLVIHRFRGIREGVLAGMGKVNLLIGPNNSGKSSILELLYLAGLSGRRCALLLPDMEPTAWPATTLCRHDLLREKPLPRVRCRHGQAARWEQNPAAVGPDGNLQVTLGALSPGHPLRRFELVPPLDEPWSPDVFDQQDADSLALFSLTETDPSWPEVDGVGEKVAIPGALLPEPIRNEVAVERARMHYLWDERWIYRWQPGEDIDRIAVWATEGLPPVPNHVLFFDVHTTAEHFRKEFTQESKHSIPDWREMIAESLARVFPELVGVRVDIDDAPGEDDREAGFLSFPERGQGWMCVDHFGDGCRQAFKLLAALTALIRKAGEDQQGVLLWEDPELFMHPASLSRLLDEILRLVRNKPVQVFLTTQSLEVLAWFALRSGREPSLDHDEIRTFRLALVDGELQTHALRGKALGSWMELFGDPRLMGEQALSPLQEFLASGESEE